MTRVRLGVAQWPLWTTTVRLVVTEPGQLTRARAIVAAELAATGQAASRFRDDSELRSLARRGGRPTRVSARLAELVRVALTAAEQTDGDVDPTVGRALRELGYDRDLTPTDQDLTPTDRDLMPTDRRSVRLAADRADVSPRVRVFSTVDWQAVRLDGQWLTVPPGVELDLGATAKAHAADRCARLVSNRLGVGILVSLGGDIATAGPPPEDGWRIRVQDRPGDPDCAVMLPAGAALATSSTVGRRWRRGPAVLHHVLDPRTGQPARPVWRTVSVAAGCCVRANTLTTAALVRGTDAVDWLRALGAPARLVAADQRVVTLGSWPAEGLS